MGRWGRSAFEEREAWTAFIERRAPVYTPPSKYGNRRTEVDGRTYASKHEAEVAATLQTLERHGKISELRYQVGFTLVEGMGKIRPIRYVADFTYRDAAGLHVVDAKGYDKNQVWRLKRKLMALLLGVEIEVV